MKVRLAADITTEFAEGNIERNAAQERIARELAQQFGNDLADLMLNGDTSTLSSDPDYDFLKVNDGWIKQIKASGHTVNRASINSGAMSDDVFYNLLLNLPDKYQDNSLRWLRPARPSGRSSSWSRPAPPAALSPTA